MPLSFRLQDLRTLDPDATWMNENQKKEDAVDIGAYRTLTVQVRKPVAGTGPLTQTLYLQHAATLDEDAFVNVTSTSFSLTTTGTEVAVFESLLRYVRWNVDVGSTATAWTVPLPQFMIDVVARES